MTAAVLNVPCFIVKCRNSLWTARGEVTSINSLTLFEKGFFSPASGVKNTQGELMLITTPAAPITSENVQVI